jgi:hypothetical protein
MEMSAEKDGVDGLATMLRPDDLKQIEDAMQLLEFAIASGFKNIDGVQIPAGLAFAIKTTAAATRTDNRLTVQQWTQFEIAYYRLALVLSPITARSLRDTADTGHWWILQVSPALRFARSLWIFTLAFATAAILSEVAAIRYGPAMEGIVDWRNTIMQFSQIIMPYAYGGLGACVYLLRSAHKYIAERSFDLHRKPEYFNRIFLGAIGGGTIILFVDQDLQQGIKLSATALGFLAGYSTDFLFSTIERVIGALLPKVGIETVRRFKAPAGLTPPTTIEPGMTVKDILDRHDASSSAEEKAFYKNLIERFSQGPPP